MSTPDGAREASAGEYSVDEDDQLQPEDTLIDRGVDDVLDEGYSPPERPYGRGSLGPTPESLDQLLAEEEPDPAMRIYDPFDKDEQQRSDEAERETEFPQRNEVGRARSDASHWVQLRNCMDVPGDHRYSGGRQHPDAGCAGGQTSTPGPHRDHARQYTTSSTATVGANSDRACNR